MSKQRQAPENLPKTEKLTKTENHTKTQPAAATDAGRERIAKVMARAGLCSRRDAEIWIADGRVTLNGEILKTPACTVTHADKILVDGRPLPRAEPARLWRYHKPEGLVTTARDEKNRPTVFSALPADMPRVVSVGRLDLNSEGLLLLTNDGGLARQLELPSTGWLRCYRVRAFGWIYPEQLYNLKDGITIGGVRYGPIDAQLEQQKGDNCWIQMGLREGKNREVRKVLAALGLQVNRLIRTAYGPLQLGKLKEGEIDEVPRRAVAEIMHSLANAAEAK